MSRDVGSGRISVLRYCCVRSVRLSKIAAEDKVDGTRKAERCFDCARPRAGAAVMVPFRTGPAREYARGPRRLARRGPSPPHKLLPRRPMNVISNSSSVTLTASSVPVRPGGERLETGMPPLRWRSKQNSVLSQLIGESII
ncbi:hypothetical protein EVAR_51482_1 [Eumeta japonica]|uniref:Uncharacterized protein n=1 Tax=Eumeta variegata TaxID=151549 RepID=A0A4C1XF42_EUMVA|nr:hypothetical protein EVAR_51482_1 [Eumeta japonica]